MDLSENQNDTEQEAQSQHADVSETETEDKHNEQLYTTRYGRTIKPVVMYPAESKAEMTALVAELNFTGGN